MLLDRFQNTLSRLLDKGDSVLVAVSGGLDSMVLLHLFQQSVLQIAVAHCNFKLRGIESDGDEQMVVDYCKKNNIKCFSQSFDTASIAAETSGENIQLTARRLRYQWFEDLCKAHQFTHIATAHHLNDSVETVLYNFTKGTGIRGMTGIPMVNNNTIRPLLSFSKKRLQRYADEHSVPFREDSSNQSDKYKRNLLRNQVIPLLEKINPNFVKTAHQNMLRFQDLELLLEKTVADFKADHVVESTKHIHIPKHLIFQHGLKRTLLYELLLPYGFNSEQVASILAGASVGSIYTSKSHRLLVDRVYLVVKTHQALSISTDKYAVDSFEESVQLPEGIFYIKKVQKSDFTLALDADCAFFDADKLHFPLVLRRWKSGDRFQPFGMQGKSQTLKKFFVNQKLNRFEKERIWLLTSHEQIAWVVGHRTDEGFKIEPSTKTIVMAWFVPNAQ